ncbi:UDP-N-acetylglucosamine pyrophosphorylase /glucosamine-1-phosphate N-acetyltransferase [Halobacillus karajensis]|uniref:Bifunctional protein GlmU n=1 Tax=Halobacillus karajensis TaxID=195088 RepID=A0A024PBI9_9BACI|nr:bifunctional UDP-N-acetylglucosamine diphosphorylase/glucosamine-1-phosphate N-acetyltransferase GlmU [Halobacillus karajensis]CDQ21776.1 Bifunctional protein GlmU [Halobacillus karajensis]CDQ25772.1 Bifunctional protein GlmU [Halobacillus karajensis]CDQ29773.1 Bifunctional protein GlmU [Halobacillus karajensis]SEI12488.1 UDP-N-acetylglucosamine pyrophosphorylase /glucosamine-1-phosphate N-acetyltransferase [Halobacillus karajensis]
MTNRYAVVLAAGQGTRMKSKLYKVLHPVCGKPMVQHVVDQLNTLDLKELITVVGFGAEKVQDQLGEDSHYVIQEEQLGTGHAVLQADDILADREGTTVVVCGDTPLLTGETLQKLIDHHDAEKAKATILTAHAEDPTGYGRVIRGGNGQVERIVEQKDASEEEQAIQEINTGTYCFDNAMLFEALKNVSNDNVQGEYYLPDVIEILKGRGETISAYQTPEFSESLGVNDRVALSKAEKLMKRRINEQHMRNGVTLVDPDQTYIGPDVEIGQDVVIYPGSVLEGTTFIENDAVIGPHTTITNCHVGAETTVKQSAAADSRIGARVQIGPFAHIRPQSNLGDDVKVGNFVEVKKAAFGNGSKASHLSYIGDAEVGSGVNIGCGTITVNYDGKNKHLTTIEDDAFIGCNSNLIAPVKVGKGAYVAAGSTINEDVPSEALSIARSRQTNKEGYATKMKSIKKD